MYYLITDVHGDTAELRTLLAEQRDRKIGKSMAVTGNHEFNSVAWTVQGLQDRGECLRPYSDKNRKQHIEFLEQVGEGSDEYRSMINWFRTSLLHIDFPNSLLVHSSWYPDCNLAEKLCTDSGNRFLAGAWITARRKNSGVFGTAETLLKVFEIRFPNPSYFLDTDVDPRRQIHNSLWQEEDLTPYDLQTLPVYEIEKVLQIPIEADLFPRFGTKKPFSTSKFWMSSEPLPSITEIDRLDYSSTANHCIRHFGYRFEGEQVFECSTLCLS